jgi:hypothetical protein
MRGHLHTGLIALAIPVLLAVTAGFAAPSPDFVVRLTK